ncbi:hypothetical protein Q0A17_12975 [Citrobacter sp. S2-9]|uniref:Uncharacterized protein n=1 Tax=Citrobacter enshiensis TaxID=2971264 RepID=A0ABT8PVD4_9ENTR|nr:hypothetical protein [Citrobacter enshiensis]MDN8600316.1 hypothetical protein [Citrobacter enshiensis]
MLHHPLAIRILATAAEHGIQAGETLPEKAFDLLLDENPDTIGEALMELYLGGLLNDAGPYEVDTLTQTGAAYLYGEKS